LHRLERACRRSRRAQVMGSIILLYIFPPGSLEWAAGLDHCECQTKKRSKTRCGCESCCQVLLCRHVGCVASCPAQGVRSLRPCMHILHVMPSLRNVSDGWLLPHDDVRFSPQDSGPTCLFTRTSHHITHAVAPPTMTCLCSLSQEFLALGIAPNIFTAWDGILSSPTMHVCLLCSALYFVPDACYLPQY